MFKLLFEKNFKKYIFINRRFMRRKLKNLKETDNLKPINPYAISKSKIKTFV